MIETIDAGKLFRTIAQAAWECADPGLQYDDTINDWHTCPETGRITASNPCSEYLHLDNSSCNLASLNLMKFLRADGGFEVEKFVKSVEFVITAMDISICFADFPTEKIGETTRAYRQLGIGYANLGALLMASGLPYDSDGGRALAGAITSLMTGTAYRRSAEMAGVVGAYDGYARNAEPHKRVMRKHAAANDDIKAPSAVATAIAREASKQWQQGIKIGEKSGWRNAQASVLAPTGTIGLMMDCDTTGVEPDLALVKFKKLVGGGSMQIVNQTVPRALRSLGYPEEQVEAIIEHIADHGHVVDAPGLKPEHYAVFDCAMGERSIAPMGHVRMMAAVQPFISGAISKTVNMPEAATVEDVEKIYFEGWKLGLKALAIYRDNCKVGQPLSVAKPNKAAAEAPVQVEKTVEKVVEYRPVRKRLPKKRPSETVSFSVGGAEGYLTASSYPDDGLGEVFLKMSKQGSTLAGVMDAFSVAISIGLQYGVPLETFVGKFTNMRFEPAGMTDDPDIRMAASVMDYIFRRLALDFLPYERRAELGIFTAKERAAQIRAEAEAEAAIDLTQMASSAPIEAKATEDKATEEKPEQADGQGRRHPGPGRGTVAAGRLLHGAARSRHRQGRRRAALLHLRHEDAPRRQLLRLRRLRLDLRLQLVAQAAGRLTPVGRWHRSAPQPGRRGGGRMSMRVVEVLARERRLPGFRSTARDPASCYGRLGGRQAFSLRWAAADRGDKPTCRDPRRLVSGGTQALPPRRGGGRSRPRTFSCVEAATLQDGPADLQLRRGRDVCRPRGSSRVARPARPGAAHRWVLRVAPEPVFHCGAGLPDLRRTTDVRVRCQNPYWVGLSVCGRLPSWCQSVSDMSTSKCFAAFLRLPKACSRSLSVTSLTWSKRAIAFRTWSASVSGSLRLSGNANAVSGRLRFSPLDRVPSSPSFTGFQVVSIRPRYPPNLAAMRRWRSSRPGPDPDVGGRSGRRRRVRPVRGPGRARRSGPGTSPGTAARRPPGAPTSAPRAPAPGRRTPRSPAGRTAGPGPVRRSVRGRSGRRAGARWWSCRGALSSCG